MTINRTAAIIQKELHFYFTNPFSYIVSAFFWFFSGFFFVEILIGKQGIIQQVSLNEQSGISLSYIDVATEFINSYFVILGTLSLLVIPILSMGLYTDEKKQGTIELLATSPIPNWSVALGKLVAVTLLFMFMLLPSFVYEAIALAFSQPPLSIAIPLLANLGLILMAISFLSLGMFFSSLTTSNVIAAISTFSMVFITWIFDLIASNFGGSIANNLKYISLLESYNNLVKGTINLNDLTLFFSYIFLGIFLSSQSMKIFRLNRQ